MFLPRLPKTPKLRPTQQKMYDILKDCQPHLSIELHGCLYDELGPTRNIEAHITGLRKVLGPLGFTIKSFTESKRLYYKLVRIFSTGE